MALNTHLGPALARVSESLESLEAKMQETLARATAGSGLSAASSQQVLNPTPEVSTLASTVQLGQDTASLASMVPAGAHLWVHGGSKAWKPMDTSKLRNFQVTRHSHSDLEDVFLEFEDWAEHEHVPQDLWYQVFLTYLSSNEKKGVEQLCKGTREFRPTYAQMRKALLAQTAVRCPAVLYLSQLTYPAHTTHTYTPTQLRTHFNAAVLKLRRALRDDNRDWFPDEDHLAGLFMEALAPACATHLEHKLPNDCFRSPSCPTLNEVIALAMKWEAGNPGGGNDEGPAPRNPSKRSEATRCPGTLDPPPSELNRPPSSKRKAQDNDQSNHNAKKGRKGSRRNGPNKKGAAQASSSPAVKTEEGARSSRSAPPICFLCRQPGHMVKDCPRAVNSVLPAGNTGTANQGNGNASVASAVPSAEQVATYNGAVQAVQALVRALPPPPPPATPQQPEQGRENAGVSTVTVPTLTATATRQRPVTLPRRVYKVLGTLTWEDGRLLATSFLLDTGASPNVIRKDLVPEGIRILPQEDIGLQAATTNHLSVEGRVEAILTIGSFHRPVSFFVASMLSCPVLLGMDFISEYGISLDYEKHHMVFPEAKHSPVPFLGATQEPSQRVCYPKERVTLAPLSRSLVEVVFPAKGTKPGTAATLMPPKAPTTAYFIQAALHQTGLAVPNCVSTGTIEVSNLRTTPAVLDTQLPLAWCYPIHPNSIQTMQGCLKALEERLQRETEETEGVGVHTVAVAPPPKLPDLTAAEQQLGKEAADQLRALCVQNQDLFADKSQAVTATTLLEAPIETTEGVVVCKPPYRQSKEQRQATQKMVAELLEQGIISRSTSPWASPICIVRKKDGSPRLCVDFREVNKHLSVPKYPLPRIDDVLQSFEGKKFFSVLDLTSGFWQIPIKKEDRHKTAFVTSEGLFEWNRMPFGLASSPAYFQRLMDLVIQGMKWTCAIAYVDDIIIFSDTLDAHVRDLQQLFVALRAANLKLSPTKCVLGAAEVHYLGHVVSRAGVRPDDSKTRAVRDYPQPKSVTELRRFLGLAQYYHRFIRNFSQVAAPLFALLKKGATFQLTPGSHPRPWL